MMSSLRLASLCGLLLCGFVAQLFAQPRYYQEWYFGFNVGVDFSQIPPGKMYGALVSTEGCASICDPATGVLLFYTSGVNVWNRTHRFMQNGQGLFGHVSSTQSALIVPKPGDPNIFYIFTAFAGPYVGNPSGGQPGRSISYSVVDIRGDGGLGSVVQKNVVLMYPSTEKLVGVPHCNGRDFWVVGHKLGSSLFYAWQVSDTGVAVTPVISDIGEIHSSDPTTAASIGYLKGSPDGRFLFSVVQQDRVGELFAFDNKEGFVKRRIATLPAYYGASFSPNSEYLYTTNDSPRPEIHRYTVLLNDVVQDSAPLVNSKAVIGSYPPSSRMPFHALQLGPDGNLYIAIEKHLGVIENPDIGGTFRDSVLTYEPVDNISDSVVANGLPNCIDAFLSSRPLKICSDSITAAFSQSDTVVCEGEKVDFADESVADPVSWQWEFQGGNPSSSAEQHPKQIEYGVPGTYSTRLIVSNGIQFDTIVGTIVVLSRPAIDAGRDTGICSGGSVQLSAAGGTDYRWDPSPDLSCLDCPNPVAGVTQSTTYYVTATNGNRCQGRDSVRVEVYAPPAIGAGGEIDICEGERSQLQASGGVTYRWDPSSDLSCLDCSDPVASPLTTTTYYVSGMDANGCTGRDSVRVNVHSFTASVTEDQSICPGQSVRLEAKGGVAWTWEPAEGLSCVDCSDPIASPTAGTLYHVTVRSPEGCTFTDSVWVNVRENPETIRFRIGRDLKGYPGDTIFFPIEVQDQILNSDITDLLLEFQYDPKVMVTDITGELMDRLLSGTMLEGWNVEIVQAAQGSIVLRLTAPPGATLAGRGELLRLEGRLFLSSVVGTELPFRLTSSSTCFVFASDTGYAYPDSICGLDFRLIELNAQKYVPPAAFPNPARERVTFEFGLGLDGETCLEVFDAGGKRVALIVREYLKPGSYAVEWNVRELSTGIYFYRLTSGDWNRTGEIRIAK